MSHSYTRAEGINEDAVYELKYQALSKRCIEVKKETDKIYERLLQCKRMLGQVLYERRALKDKLERQYNEKLSQVVIPAFHDEDFAYEVLISQKQACQSSASTTDIALPNQSLVASKSRKRSNLPSQSCFSDGINTPSNDDGSNSFPNGNRRLSKAKSKKKSSATAFSSDILPPIAVPPTKKDPDAPKKPVNAYFIFCDKNRSTVQVQLTQEQSGEVDRKEVTRRLGQMWGALTNDEKAVYYDEYHKDKVRYNTEMEEYASKQTDLSGSFGAFSEPYDRSLIASTSSTPTPTAPSKPKKARKSVPKLKTSLLNGIGNANHFGFIPSTASSPAGIPNSSASNLSSFLPASAHAMHGQQFDDGSGMLLPRSSTGFDDVYQNITVKAENEPGEHHYFTSTMDNVSSPSSLTPTLMDNCPTFDKLNHSPLTYANTAQSLYLAGVEDATDEVFMSTSHHFFNSESPGIVVTGVNNSSSGETPFEVSNQQQNFMHSIGQIPQLFLHHHHQLQSGNEMPVP